MTYTAKYQTITTQRAYSRAVAAGGLSALLAPYRVAPVPVVPSQRRRSVQPERISA